MADPKLARPRTRAILISEGHHHCVMLRRRQVADLLGISIAALDMRLKRGTAPSPTQQDDEGPLWCQEEVGRRLGQARR